MGAYGFLTYIQDGSVHVLNVDHYTDVNTLEELAKVLDYTCSVPPNVDLSIVYENGDCQVVHLHDSFYSVFGGGYDACLETIIKYKMGKGTKPVVIMERARLE